MALRPGGFAATLAVIAPWAPHLPVFKSGELSDLPVHNTEDDILLALADDTAAAANITTILPVASLPAYNGPDYLSIAVYIALLTVLLVFCYIAFAQPKLEAWVPTLPQPLRVTMKAVPSASSYVGCAVWLFDYFLPEVAST
jgi:hypothetical protein